MSFRLDTWGFKAYSDFSQLRVASAEPFIPHQYVPVFSYSLSDVYISRCFALCTWPLRPKAGGCHVVMAWGPPPTFERDNCLCARFAAPCLQEFFLLLCRQTFDYLCECFTEAVPKRILDLMSVEGLTRENVASHLQVLPLQSHEGLEAEVCLKFTAACRNGFLLLCSGLKPSELFEQGLWTCLHKVVLRSIAAGRNASTWVGRMTVTGAALPCLQDPASVLRIPHLFWDMQWVSDFLCEALW